MTRTRTNRFGQAVGEPLGGWSAPPALAPVSLAGRWVRLEPLVARHALPFHDAACGPDRESSWTYLYDEMPGSSEAAKAYAAERGGRPGLHTLAVVPVGRTVEGLVSWLRVDAEQGSAEVGGIILAPTLQRTTEATEAMWLMARHAFDLGYRRYEWKCDALNTPSLAAATRLGFTYEGTFRSAVVYKGRNRDTAWFSITDDEWRALTPAYDAWLDPANFEDPATGEGQRSSLSTLTARIRRPSTGMPGCAGAAGRPASRLGHRSPPPHPRP